jgi:hypothetical protein
MHYPEYKKAINSFVSIIELLAIRLSIQEDLGKQFFSRVVYFACVMQMRKSDSTDFNNKLLRENSCRQDCLEKLP